MEQETITKHSEKCGYCGETFTPPKFCCKNAKAMYLVELKMANKWEEVVELGGKEPNRKRAVYF